MDEWYKKLTISFLENKKLFLKALKNPMLSEKLSNIRTTQTTNYPTYIGFLW